MDGCGIWRWKAWVECPVSSNTGGPGVRRLRQSAQATPKAPGRWATPMFYYNFIFSNIIPDNSGYRQQIKVSGWVNPNLETALNVSMITSSWHVGVQLVLDELGDAKYLAWPVGHHDMLHRNWNHNTNWDDITNWGSYVWFSSRLWMDVICYLHEYYFDTILTLVHSFYPGRSLESFGDWSAYGFLSLEL